MMIDCDESYFDKTKLYQNKNNNNTYSKDKVLLILISYTNDSK